MKLPSQEEGHAPLPGMLKRQRAAGHCPRQLRTPHFCACSGRGDTRRVRQVAARVFAADPLGAKGELRQTEPSSGLAQFAAAPLA